jgi:hypothetical protein
VKFKVPVVVALNSASMPGRGAADRLECLSFLSNSWPKVFFHLHLAPQLLSYEASAGDDSICAWSYPASMPKVENLDVSRAIGIRERWWSPQLRQSAVINVTPEYLSHGPMRLHRCTMKQETRHTDSAGTAQLTMSANWQGTIALLNVFDVGSLSRESSSGSASSNSSRSR